MPLSPVQWHFGGVHWHSLAVLHVGTVQSQALIRADVGDASGGAALAWWLVIHIINKQLYTDSLFPKPFPNHLAPSHQQFNWEALDLGHNKGLPPSPATADPGHLSAPGEHLD